jgi:GNAT superfamily N-acetyltransferase
LTTAARVELVQLHGVTSHAMREDERALVAATWKRSIVEALRAGGMMWGDESWPVANAAVDSLLERCAVVVASSLEDGVEIAHGWAARLGGRVIARHVKPRYRGMGIEQYLEAARADEA